MAWEPFSLHFRQILDGGYRYLDKTGEFMIVAENEFNLVPAEIQVTGAKLEKPEDSISISVDTRQITLAQNFPADHGEIFLETTKLIVGLVEKFFSPIGTLSNGFQSNSYWPVGNAEKALAASVNIGGAFHSDLGKSIGMVPIENDVNCLFQSGSKELRVHIQPVAIERTPMRRQTSALRDTKQQKARIARINQRADRLPTIPEQGIMMALDLQEKEPPRQGDLQAHFLELLAQEVKLKDIIAIK